MRIVRIVLLSVFYIFANTCFAAEIYNRDNVAPCIVKMEQKNIVRKNINGEIVELWQKKKGSTKPEPLYESIYGSGFLIVKDNTELYLVTADHVARKMTPSASIMLKGNNDAQVRMDLSTLCGKGNNLPWVTHPDADVAVLHLSPSQEVIDQHLQKHFLPIDILPDDKKPPRRDVILTIFGFPLIPGAPIVPSPITKTSYPASDFLTLLRFDNNQVSTFVLLEDPSIGGFSGGPVIDLSIVKMGSMVTTGSGTKIVGLVHGTISDKTGGKLAAVVPGYLILETIGKASQKFNK